MWSFLMLYQPIIALMIITGFLNMEDSGSSIKASLPINPRDQIKAKLIILIIIQSLSFFLPIIVIILVNPAFQSFILLFISWYPITLVFLLIGLLLKLKMFGRMKYKFVLEEVNPEKKVQKWAFLISMEVLIYLIYAILGSIILIFSNIILMSAILFLTSSTIIVFLLTSLNRMFPKSFGKKVMISVRESFRKEPIKGTGVLLIIYALFLFLPGLIELPLNNFTIPIIPAALIDFFISFGVMAFLWLFLVPRVLHIPIGNEKIKAFSKSIGLTGTKNLTRNIILGIGCSIIFFISTYITANIFGTYIFDLDVIFGVPSLSPLRIGWLYFVIMLIPGIWEEVSFRGVITTLHLRKYSDITSLILVSVLFGLFHLINLLSLQPIIPTIIQVLYATILGILFGYLFIKTRSLIPSIILHYLIDSAGQLFMNAYFSDMGSFFLFAFLGIGVFPAVFGILFVHSMMKLVRRE
jgi:membrane protease YdiL (CAAX protease family)